MTDFLSQENQTRMIMESNFLQAQQANKPIQEAKQISQSTESEKSPAVRKREHKMTEQEKEENRKILKSMNRKLNFLRNPRFRDQSKCLLYSNALFQEILNKENPFVVEPMVVTFREYQLNSVYQLDLKLTNRKQILTSFKYIPPLTEHFSVKRIIYPKKDTSLIAPGMHAKIELLFNASSLDCFEDEISIITEFFAFKVPLRAIREKPSLSLENPMNCGKCLLGDQTSMVFRCRNNGGDAHFKFLVDENAERSFFNMDQNYDNNLNANNNNNENNNSNNNYNNRSSCNSTDYNNNGSSNNTSNSNGNQNSQQSSGTNYTVDNEVLVTGPFSIFPQEFYLYKGMSVEIYVNFNPKYEGLIEKNLFICCDSKVNIPHKIQGEGIGVDFKIMAIDDLIADETFEKLENIFFEDAYPSTSVSRRLIIKNLSKFQLKYHWNIFDMYENNKNFLDENKSYFSITPESGVFEPLQELAFFISFQPKNCKNYEQKLDLIIEDVPFHAIKNFKINNLNNNFDNFGKNSGSIKLAKNTFTKGEPFMLALNSPYPSYPFFSFNLLGKGKQCEMDVDSKIIDLGKVYIGEKINKKFNLYNTKSGVLKFKIAKILQGMKNSLTENSKFSSHFMMGNNSNSYSNEILKSTVNAKNTENAKAKYGFDNGKMVNNYFKWTDPGKTFTDHFRTESIFKLKKPLVDLSVNEIFERFKKEKEYFKEKEDDMLLDVNKSIVINDELENARRNNNETNKYLKSVSSQNDYFRNTKSEIDNNFLNYSNLKNGKFLKLLTCRENFTNKVLMRENSKSLKHIPTRNSFNGPNKYLSKNIRIKDSFNTNNNSSSGNDANNNLNLNKMNSVIIRRPESNVTCLSTNFANNKSNNQNKIKIKNSLSKKILEPISENVNETTSNNNNNIGTKKSAYLLSKPLARSQQLQSQNHNNNNNSENTLAQSQINNLKDLIRSHSKKGLLKTLSSQKSLESNNVNNLNLNRLPSNLRGSNFSKSTNSYLIKNQNSLVNDEDPDEIEINESDELVINKDQTVAINVSFQPFKLGLFKCSCILKAEDGIPFSVDFTANVIGPQVIADIPAIDFGLFSISEIRTIRFKLVNTSRSPAKYLIKESRYKTVNFENYLECAYLNDLQGVIVERKFKKRVENLNDFENENMRVMDFNVIDSYELKFSPICGIIKENSEVEITASFVSAYPKYLNDQIEVMVQNSESLFINIYADCQEAFAYIDKILIHPINIYVGVPITFENNLLKIVNPSNLPINFEWLSINNPDEKIIEFYPRRGTVRPRSYVEISYRMTYFMMKTLDEIYICKIEQMDIPLGINVRGMITGLDIVFEYTDEAFNQMHLLGKLETASIQSSLTSTSLIRKTLSMKSSNRFLKSGSIKLDKSLKQIDLKNLKVNRHFNFKFVLKNLSGISTNFVFYSKYFAPGIEKDLKYEMLSKSTQLNIKPDNNNNVLSSRSNFLLEHQNSAKTLNSVNNPLSNSVVNTFNNGLNINGNVNENKSSLILRGASSNKVNNNSSNYFNNDRYSSYNSMENGNGNNSGFNNNNSSNNNNNYININNYSANNSINKDSIVTNNNLNNNNNININIINNINSSRDNKNNNSNKNPNLGTGFNPSNTSLKNIKTLNSLRYSQLAGKGSAFSTSENLPIGHELLNDRHENIIFTSPQGIEHTKMKQVEKESHMYLSNKKGVALVIEPKQGRLDPYSDVLVSITVYNECVGDFEDELICQIKGLPDRRFPIQLRIRGNPLQLAPFQTGFDYNQEPPVLKMGNVLTKINSISKSFKVINTGANLIMLDWKLFDYNKILEPEEKSEIYKVKICESKSGFSLKYIPCEPPQIEEAEKTYAIEPKNFLVQPKGVKEFKVSFSAKEAGLRSALLVAFPKFMDNNSTSNVGLSELAIKIDAYGVTPNLLVDKTLHFTGKYIYRFYLHSFGASPKPKKSVVLINKERINFLIKLIVEGPFKISKTEPIESTVGNSIYNINPKQNLKVELKAISPDPKKHEEWPINLVNEKHGKLICVFENGETQEYFLTSVLKRPRLSISVTGNDAIEGENCIDFGSVNCESFKKSVLFIKNETDVSSDWSINYHKFVAKKTYGYGTTTKDEREDMDMNDDPDVFLFSVTTGVIPGPSLPLINIPLGPCLPKVDNFERDKLLPMKVEIMFKPKKNVFYKCRYTILTSTGNKIEFILKGNGSFKEEEII